MIISFKELPNFTISDLTGDKALRGVVFAANKHNMSFAIDNPIKIHGEYAIVLGICFCLKVITRLGDNHHKIITFKGQSFTLVRIVAGNRGGINFLFPHLIFTLEVDIAAEEILFGGLNTHLFTEFKEISNIFESGSISIKEIIYSAPKIISVIRNILDRNIFTLIINCYLHFMGQVVFIKVVALNEILRSISVKEICNSRIVSLAAILCEIFEISIQLTQIIYFKHSPCIVSAKRCAQTLRFIKEGQKFSHMSHITNIAENATIVVSRNTIVAGIAANCIHKADNAIFTMVALKELTKTSRAKVNLPTSRSIGHNASVDVKVIRLINIVVDESDNALIAGKSVSVRNSHFENLLFFFFILCPLDNYYYTRFLTKVNTFFEKNKKNFLVARPGKPLPFW